MTTAVLIFVSVVPLLTHHSVRNEFDSTKATTIAGVITKVEWTNPHVWIYMNAKDASGRISTWGVEMAAPAALAKSGFEKGFFDLTHSFSIEIWLARNGANKGNGRTLTLPDGRTFDISDKWPDGSPLVK